MNGIARHRVTAKSLAEIKPALGAAPTSFALQGLGQRVADIIDMLRGRAVCGSLIALHDGFKNRLMLYVSQETMRCIRESLI